MTLTRPPTPPKVLISHALVIVALGATLSPLQLGLVAVGFSGSSSPWTARDLILLASLLGMCVGAALCWKWPRIGTPLFVVSWIVAFIACRGEPESAAECFRQLVTTEIGGAFLLVNLFLTELWRRVRSLRLLDTP